MLWAERKRLAELAKREAAGESLWSEDIDSQARTKLLQIWYRCTGGPGAAAAVWSFIEEKLIHDAGITVMEDEGSLLTKADTDLVLSLIEGAAQAMRQYSAGPPQTQPWGLTAKTSFKPVGVRGAC